MPFTIYESPFGPLTLVGDGSGLRHLYFPRRAPRLDEEDHEPHALRATSERALRLAPGHALGAATEQLEEYFCGARTAFDLPLALDGTPFQRAVWRALREIPYGSTTTYGALAHGLAPHWGGDTPNPRAVGAAVGATPIPIIIPCHRVIGADGSLTGYGGGLHRKQALLDFEAAGGQRSGFGAAGRQRQLTLL